MKEFFIVIAAGLLLFWLALDNHYSACRLIEEANQNHKVLVPLEGISEGGCPKQYLLGRWSHSGLMKLASNEFEMAQIIFVVSFEALTMAILLLLDNPIDLHLILRHSPLLRENLMLPKRLNSFLRRFIRQVRGIRSLLLRLTLWQTLKELGLVNIRVARIIVGFLILLPAGAMHGTAADYATEPTNLARLATARSINFAASLMDMGAGALILIGAVPMVVSRFVRQPRSLGHEVLAQLALPPPSGPDQPAGSDPV